MSSRADPATAWWQQWMRMNEQYTDVAGEAMEAQTRFVEAWGDSFDEATRQERLDEGLAATYHAYEVWMQAVEETVEGMNDILEGEDVPVERFRDAWLNAANQAFKESMRTAAFAEATGQSVDDALALQRQFDDATEATLHGLGLPARGDVEEIGERLVELERRNHAIEERLDRIVDAVEPEE